MKFELNLVAGTIIKRYKRFLADIRLENGDVITAHCPNPGSMLTCYEEGAPIMLTYHNDPKRRTQYTLEMIKIGSTWIGVNTSRPNAMVYQLIKEGHIPAFKDSTDLKREVKYKNSRFDIALELDNESWFVEIKSVSMGENNIAYFPDSPTERGRKHLLQLTELVKSNQMKTALIYFIQRDDVEYFKPAASIDPTYVEILNQAIKAGVQIFALKMKVSPNAIEYEGMIQVVE